MFIQQRACGGARIRYKMPSRGNDVRWWLQIGVLGLAAAGCGGSSGPPPLTDVANCSAAWQPITFPARKGTYSPLVFAGGVLYYSAEVDSDIRALSLTGGQETVIAPSNWAEGLWLEGDHLLFSEQSRFFSLPLAGGTAQLLFDGVDPNRPVEPPFSFAQAVSATDLVWIEQGGNGTVVKRVARAGGEPATIGDLDQSIYQGMALSPTAAIVATNLGYASMVPLDGSGARSLATGGHLFVAVTADGAYWSDTGTQTANMTFAPADGGPVRPFWPDLPYGVAPWRMWPDGAGGWIVYATQLFSDQRYHGSIWLLDAQGEARLAACDAVGGDNSGIVGSQPAVSDDAIYVAALAGSSLLNTIVRIPR
jgi:hypothetical protein